MFERYIYLDTFYSVGLGLGIFLLFLVLRKLFTKYVFRLILRISNKTPTMFFTNTLLAYEKPLRWFFVITGMYLAYRTSSTFENQSLFIQSLYKSSIVILIASGLYNLTSSSSILLKRVNDRFQLEMDDILVPFLSKMLRFVIIAITFSIIAQEFEYDVNGFIAGLGLGGLAFALAAKDTIGNFFGGVIIITEKPFTIGDWVKTPSVEGIVEDITFRSTKIRTFQQAIVTVPNSTLSNEPIMNWSKMGKRQITFSVGVTYSTSRVQLERSVDRIREMLLRHEDIHDEVIMVNFDKFADSSLDIFFNFFTKTTVYAEYLRVKQDVNYQIMSILEEEDVAFAFPSQTLYIEGAGKHELMQEKPKVEV
ncbi:mechanosensitive ion channel [Bacillus lacus]|uniref:Mechanosensitive ion channel n=1 Tax=Metabacillus lacus TaxID=1983721 RepID=A0A7X2IXC2_9BACI|nr:mechanosensitive ion channel family protein [Metabacillus lacus]MRX71520.1 mechanosensitive ion channel [Metabacillus lacus]